MINEVYYILVAFINDSRSILQREQHKLAAAESDSSTQSTQSSAKYKWDTHFNRAMNIMMGHPPG